MLTRIEKGFETSFKEYQSAEKNLIAQHQKQYSDLMFSFQQLSDNFKSLKKETDLDRAFLEGFDEKTRIVLLRNI